MTGRSGVRGPVGEPILAFEKGEIDLTSVPPDLVPRYAGNPEFALVKSPAFWGYRLVFNMEKSPPLKNTRVRQSICLAINRDELVEKIARGAAVPGEAGILPPGHVMYHKPKITYDFDPAQAVRLLQDQGFHVADGQGEITGAPLLDFHLLISTQEVRMAELIKERLGQVGIMVHLISVDGKTRDARVRDGDYQMAIIGPGKTSQHNVPHTFIKVEALAETPPEQVCQIGEVTPEDRLVQTVTGFVLTNLLIGIGRNLLTLIAG